jgi:hypothetical protein
MDKNIFKESAMRIAALLALVSLLAACSTTSVNPGGSALVTTQAPLPSGYLLSTQPTMQAMSHWDRLAAKVAENCAKAIDHFAPEGGLRVYVAPAGTTPFAKAYRESLLTRLVDYGMPVAFSPDGAAILETGTQVVTHQRALAQTPSGRRNVVEPGFVQGKDAQGMYLPVPVVAEESGAFSKEASNTEIQITSALIHQEAYLYRDSSIFYVNAQDWAHYQLQAPSGTVELKHFTLVHQ